MQFSSLTVKWHKKSELYIASSLNWKEIVHNNALEYINFFSSRLNKILLAVDKAFLLQPIK